MKEELTPDAIVESELKMLLLLPFIYWCIYLIIYSLFSYLLSTLICVFMCVFSRLVSYVFYLFMLFVSRFGLARPRRWPRGPGRALL